VTVTAKDASGNTSTKTFTVTVRVTCPGHDDRDDDREGCHQHQDDRWPAPLKPAQVLWETW